MKSIFIVAAVIALPGGARALDMDRCVRQLCTSTAQQDCMLKGVAAMCDADQVECHNVEETQGVKVVRKSGHRWLIETAIDGSGWVSDKRMLVDARKCR